MNALIKTLNEVMNIKRAGKRECISCPTSKVLIKVLELMKKEGYIDYKIINDKFEKVVITIKKLNECRAITPRFYVQKKELDKFTRRYLPARDFGILIISTDKGLLTNREVMEQGLGGSLIAYCF